MSTPQPLDDYLLELLQPGNPADAGKAAAAASPHTVQGAAPATATDDAIAPADGIEPSLIKPSRQAGVAAEASESEASAETRNDDEPASAAAPADAGTSPPEASAAASGSPAAAPPAAAPNAVPAGKTNDLITEDEFEALLDQLHGPVKHDTAPPPAASAMPAPSAPVAAPTAATVPTAAVAAPPQAPAPPAPAPMPPVPAAAPSEPVRAIPPRAVPADLFAPPPPMNRRAEERRTRWLLMRCAGQDYAVELLKVQEVVLPTTLLPLRGATPSMLGVMNLRGQVVPVIDLSTYLHRPVQEDDAATRFVVLEEHGETLGLRVSAVAEVVDISIRQIETSEHIQTGRTATGLFHGVARIGKSTVILLDASILMQ